MRKNRFKAGVLASFLINAFMCMSPSRAPAAELFADMVVLNANVITIDERNPRAEAFAVRDGKIVAVGTTSEIKALVGKDTNVIDAQGKTITPGFNDAKIAEINFVHDKTCTRRHIEKSLQDLVFT